jgi:hypothetical protein
MKSKNMGTALRLRDGRSLPIEFIARLESGSHPNSTEAHGAERRREIEFAHLSDGTLVDLLCDRSGELIFAVLQNGMITVRHTVKDAGISFITPEVHSSLTRAVRFPTAIGANHAARQLLLEIEEVLERYFDCDPSHRNLLAHFALYSWLSDLFAVAPHIWVVGPYCSGKTTLLRIMSAICRRSILVGDASTPALYAINEAFRPTVLIDEFELGKDSKSRDFLRMLRAGSTMDQRVFRALRVYSLFGPKIIASRVGPGDAALASRGFYVVARASSRPVSVLTPSVLESIAQQLQPKLAAFRLYNYAHLKSVSASLPLYAGFSPRVQDMARALALPITDDADLESQLLEIVRVHDQQGGVGRDGEPEWFVAIALLHLAHVLGPGAPRFWTAKILAEDVRSLGASRGESNTPTPRKVGEILRSLGLSTEKLGSLGRGLKNSAQLKDQIHEIAKGLGICRGDLLTPAFPDIPVTCARCERYGLNFDNTGRKIRYIPFSIGPEDPENPSMDL